MNGTPVWQIDGNYGLTSGVAEMLLQSQLGYVQFLPAIPSAWTEGEVKGLKARGNFTISEMWKNNMVRNSRCAMTVKKKKAHLQASTKILQMQKYIRTEKKYGCKRQ